MRRFLIVVLAACSSSKAPATGGSAAEPGGSADSLGGSAADPCSPAALNLAGARPLVRLEPPPGCEVRQPLEGTVLVRSPAEAAQRIVCTGAPLGIDFATTQLAIIGATLSPATTGIDALDDGKTITLVRRQRTNCPDDPQPMPMPFTAVFVVGDAGARAFADATCTTPRACP